MKRILAGLLVAVATASLIAVTPAEAKRLGGGSSAGMKRAAPASPPPAVTPQPAAPAQGAAAPASPAPATPPASSGSKWLGPLAGLGIGAGLMALFGGSAMGAAIGSMFAMLALAALAYFLFQMFRRKPQAADSHSMRYAGLAPDDAPRPPMVNPVADYPVSAGPVAATPVATLDATPRYPQGFDAEEFVRQAKISFIRLQAANDIKDLRDIRDFTTPELYAELAMQIQERDDTPQRTDVVSLNAEVIEAATEQDRIIASVRYTGLIREEAGRDAMPFDETWHVVKDLTHARPTWHIAGIQQNS